MGQPSASGGRLWTPIYHECYFRQIFMFAFSAAMQCHALLPKMVMATYVVRMLNLWHTPKY